jgi:hypothetical protein
LVTIGGAIAAGAVATTAEAGAGATRAMATGELDPEDGDIVDMALSIASNATT